MKSRIHRIGATALVLTVYLSAAPVATAAGPSETRIAERFKRIIKQLQQVVGGISTNSDLPGPPKP